MPLFDSLKRLFGIPDSRPKSIVPYDDHLDAVDRQTIDTEPPRKSPVIEFDTNIELSEEFIQKGFQQLENFMRSLPNNGFPFGFEPSGPSQPSDPYLNNPGPFGGPSMPESGKPVFPFFEHFFPVFSSIFGPEGFRVEDGPEGFFSGGVGPGGFQGSGFGPRGESSSPRDEVLKPSYKSSAPEIYDEDYDALVKKMGPGVIVDLLKKSEETEQNKEQHMVPAPRTNMAPQSMGRFTSTKFSWVNGKSVQEQITSLPDGTFEKRVTTTGPNGETNTVVSQHTAEEVMPQRRGFGGGFGGPSFW